MRNFCSTRYSNVLALVVLLSALQPLCNPASARWHLHNQKSAASSKSKKSAAKPASKRPAAAPQQAGNAAAGATSDGKNDDQSANATPVVVPPSALVDLSTAKFGKLDVDLENAAFLDASAKDLHMVATNMDMNSGSLDALSLDMRGAEFQDFTIDDMTMTSQGSLKFDTNQLLNNKVLQFREPATATAKVIISQTSLNLFLNSPVVLARLSGSAKKRVPLLSTLARQDVNFGFDFLYGHVDLLADDHLHLTMNSKVGVGKMKVPVPISVDTKLALQQGWVNLTDTHLLTSGQLVPHDMATRIVNRVNSLSKWGTASDDMQFQFTNLKVVPEDRLELEGTAIIHRIRLTRANEADNTPH